MRILGEGLQYEMPTTGVTKATLGLYKACMEMDPGCEVRVLHRGELKCKISTEFAATQAGARLSPRWWRRLVLPFYARTWNADCIHYPNGHFRHLSLGVPVVSTLHDLGMILWTDGEEREGQRRRIQWELDRADLTITWSEYSKQDICKQFHVKKEPVVIPLAPYIPEDEPESKIDIQAYGKFFLYSGGYWVHRKGLEALVKVFTELYRQGRLQCKLIMVGTKRPMTPEFEQMLSFGLEIGALEELGYVTNKELMALYNGAVAMVYPSRCEGFGLPPLEAMSMGCPVITTKCMSIPEICGDAVCYVDPDDEQGFAKALVSLQDTVNLREELKEKGVKRAALFTWRSSAEKFISEIGKLSADKSRGAGTVGNG